MCTNLYFNLANLYALPFFLSGRVVHLLIAYLPKVFDGHRSFIEAYVLYIPRKDCISVSNFLQVEEMAKELDMLLECIEGVGGFKDTSIALQKSSVVALEEGIWTVSERCRMWRVSFWPSSYISCL